MNIGTDFCMLPLHRYTHVTVCGLHGAAENKKMPDFSNTGDCVTDKSCEHFSNPHRSTMQMSALFGILLLLTLPCYRFQNAPCYTSGRLDALEARSCVQLDKAADWKLPGGQPCDANLQKKNAKMQLEINR